jgi:predicted  nucleic acid-binding Zn-ribbon protein
VPPDGFYSAPAAWSPEQEVEFLKNQSSAMEQEIKRIRGRIDELSRKQAAE